MGWIIFLVIIGFLIFVPPMWAGLIGRGILNVIVRFSVFFVVWGVVIYGFFMLTSEGWVLLSIPAGFVVGIVAARAV